MRLTRSKAVPGLHLNSLIVVKQPIYQQTHGPGTVRQCQLLARPIYVRLTPKAVSLAF